MVTGISHLTFVVKDLERTANLFQTVFGAREIYSSGDRAHSLSREKFFLIREVWVALMEGEPLRERSYNHVAFEIPPDDYDACLAKILELGLEIRGDRRRVPGEGRSLYFYDYDNHLFELHAGSREDRLAAYGAST